MHAFELIVIAPFLQNKMQYFKHYHYSDRRKTQHPIYISVSTDGGGDGDRLREDWMKGMLHDDDDDDDDRPGVSQLFYCYILTYACSLLLLIIYNAGYINYY